MVMAPFFLYQAWRHQKYLPALRQRLGHLPESVRGDKHKPTIWIHSCSVGETLSVVPLAQALHQRFPDARFVFSTITRTGQAIASERFAVYGAGCTFYFPVDLASIANRVLDWVQPTLLVTIDTEIWPNLLHEAHRRSIPIALCNGRISAESFRWYIKVAWALRAVFQNYALLLMKSTEDAQRAKRLGAPPARTLVSGNLKYDRGLAEAATLDAQARALDAALALSPSVGPLIVAGSTHPGEEAVLLAVLKRLRALPGLAGTRLLLVPRHPERFAAVAELARREGFPVRRRSENGVPSDGPPAPTTGNREGEARGSTPEARSSTDAPPPVLLLDTLGELTAAYGFATVAFVGGTLISHGGQSIMEPALHGKPIVVGPSMDNFPGIIDDFRDAGAIVQIAATDADQEAQRAQLTDAFARLLQDPAERERMGNAARSIFQASQGATQFTVDHLAVLYEKALAP